MRRALKSCFALAAIAIGLLASSANSQPANPASSPTTEARLIAVEIKTGPNWDPTKPPNEQNHFRGHSVHLKKLRDAGHIVMGARYSDKGLLVFSASSVAEVKALMEQDPSMAAETFKFEVHDFNVFYPGTLQARTRR